MSKTQHTPGPWIAHGKTVKGNTCRDSANITIARADSRGKFVPGYDEANAKLIAAAPDMLAALEVALRYVDRPIQSSDMRGRARELAISAIAKATA